MLDIEIIRFYNSLKDPSWPEIQNYNDYCLLPDYIKEECKDLHQFLDHKKNICDIDYWVEHCNISVYVHKNLAYVPVPKCASTYYSSLFANLGWKKSYIGDLDRAHTKFFSPIMHPLQRRIKVITQWQVLSYRKDALNLNKPTADWDQLNRDLTTPYFKKLIESVLVGDAHSLPYSSMLGSLIDEINWVPMESLSHLEINQSLTKFFKLHGHNIQLPTNDQPLHTSSNNQLQIFNIVKELIYNNPENFYNFYKLYINDLKLYYSTVENFTPDWQHIQSTN